MKATIFASRNLKEMLRDPLNLAFGLGFPVAILLLLSAIQANIPKEASAASMFQVSTLTPGIAVFGLSFISLFSGMLISKDRSSSYLIRLFTSPLSSSDFIIGYTLPLLPMAIAQSLICFIVAFFLGLDINANILLALVVMIPMDILYIGIGLLAGTLFTDKQVGGICGALLTNISAWLSGTWFDVKLVGGWFEKIADCLPFVHAVDACRSAVAGNYGDILKDLWWCIGYGVVIFCIAIFVFRKKMKSIN